MYPDGGPTHIPSPAELGFPVYTNLRPEDSSTLLHIRAENEKAFNAADFAFRSGITDPQALADMTEDQKRLFMNGTKNPETGAWEGGALQHGRARGNPTPKTKYQVNRATGSMLDGHTLRLAQAHLAKMIADAGGGDMAPSGAQLEGAQALLQAKAQANPSLLDRIDAAGEESTQWLRDNGIFDGSGLGANRMLDPEAVYHLARSVAGDVARGVKTIKQAASDLMDKVRSIYPDANVTQAGMSGAIHKALNDYTGLNEIARKKQLQQLPPEALAQMRYEPGPKGLPGTITGNVEASALISRLSKLDDIVGLSFTRQHLQQYLRQAQWELYHKAVSSHDEEGNQYAVQLAPRQLDQLRQAIVVFKQALASKDDSFTYAEEDTPEDFEKTQREEWFHAQQRKHLGLGSGPDHIDNDAFFAHPLAQTAATSLVENYDYPIHPDILSAEIGAKIAAGSWDELGLEESEARDLFYEYGRLVVDRHGPGAVFKFREISPILREAFYDAGRTQGQIRGSTGALDFGRTVDPTSSVPRRAGESANPLDRGGPEGQGRVRPGVERSFSREVPVSRQGQVSATATGRDGRSSTLQAVAKRKSGAQIEAERIMAQLRARKGRQ